MLFKEIYSKNQSPLYAEIYTKYGEMIADWFYFRFKNFELLYDSETFYDLFMSMVYDSHMELLKIKDILTIQTQWDLGNKVESSSYMVSDAVSDGTQSYQGYNVEGDFSKNSTTGKTNANTTAKTKSINFTDEYMKLLDYDFTVLFDKIYKKFVALFVIMI